MLSVYIPVWKLFLIQCFMTLLFFSIPILELLNIDVDLKFYWIMKRLRHKLLNLF